MASTIKKVIRVVLSRQGDQRTLLKMEYHNNKKNNDKRYLSTAAKEKRHQTYHQDGRFHTNTGKWSDSDRDYYQNIRKGNPLNEINNIKIFQCLVLWNEKYHHQELSLFKEHKKRSSDSSIKLIDEKTLDDGCLIAITSGCGENKEQITRFFENNKNDDSTSLLFVDIVECDEAPPIFVAAFKGNKSEEAVKLELQKKLNLKNIFIPHKYNYVLATEHEVTETIVIRGDNFGDAPPHINPSRPYLPKIAKEGAKEYEVVLTTSPFESRYVEAGSLSLRAIPTNRWNQQFIFIAPTLTVHNSLTINFARIDCMVSSAKGKILRFEFSQTGGYTEQQIEIENLHYQIEIKSLGIQELNINNEVIPYGEAQGIQRYTYDVKIIELDRP